MKAQEIPPRLRGFHKVFEMIGQRWNYTNVFDDFLSMAMCAFAYGREEERYFEVIKKYDRRELDLFVRLMAEWLRVQDKETAEGGWFDMLGAFYEVLSQGYKQKRLAQFFTPPEICDLMASLTGPTAEDVGKMMNDPACGSGRILLAMHANAPRNLYVGQDVDVMCCKMTCLNMMIHGVVGEVHHMNTLTQDWRGAWIVNHKWKTDNIMSILRAAA